MQEHIADIHSIQNKKGKVMKNKTGNLDVASYGKIIPSTLLINGIITLSADRNTPQNLANQQREPCRYMLLIIGEGNINQIPRAK